MANREHRTGSAREDWNRRAREDFRHAISTATSGAEQEAAFRRSGEVDAAELLSWVEAGDTSSWTVLEYGCGVGRLMAPLAHSFRALHGIDVSDEMVRLAREREGSRGELSFHVLPEGKVALPFPDGCFDLVYSAHVFQHIPRAVLRAILPELRRVLGPSGQLVFQLNRPYSARRKLQALLRAEQLSLHYLRRGRGGTEETFRRRYYTDLELRSLLARNGLELVLRGIARSNPKHVYYRVRPLRTFA